MKNLNTYIRKWFPIDSLETKEEKYKAYVIIYFTLFSLSFQLFLVVLNEYISIYDYGYFLLDCVITIVYIVILRRHLNLVLVGNVMALGGFILLTIHTLNSGGIYFFGFIWAIIAPMIAFCFANLRSGIFWTGIIIIYSFCLYYIEINAVQSGFETIPKNPTYYLLSSTLLFAFIGVLLVILKQGNELIIEELTEQRKLLWEQKQETLKKAEMLQEAKFSLIDQNKVLEEAKITLSSQNKELKQFAYATSHDLKQPLRSIKSFSKILNNHLNRKGWVDNDTEEYIAFIVKGSENMNVFITDLLKYACVFDESTTYIETDINNLLSSVEESLFDSIKSTHTTIIYEDLPSLPIIPVKINQLFQNLISNAIKFRKKEENLVLKIVAKESNTHWEFMIEDNGIGIAEEYKEVIFQPFRKLHSKEEYSGSGIGLATCRKIVGMHKGNIWVESTLGKGTRFYFTVSKNIKEVPDMKKIKSPMMRVV